MTPYPFPKVSAHKKIVIVILLAGAILAGHSPANASTYLDIRDDVYAILSRLEAEGVVRSGLLSTRPLSRAEIVRLYREAELNSAGKSEFIKDLVRELKLRLMPEGETVPKTRVADEIYVKYVYTNVDVERYFYPPGPALEKEQTLNHNNDGDLYARGSNHRTGLVSRIEDMGSFSLYLNPEVRASDHAQRIVLHKGYVVIGLPGVDIMAGKNAQWWGPGYHGSLLMSNNAEPLTMVKLANPEPLILPWVFSYLGPFRYDFFLSRLEYDRSDFAYPYFWGLRLDFKPHPSVEIGLGRTGILGGRGRPANLSLWFRAFNGTSEDGGTPEGDQRAGGDIKITLPFQIQPVQLYWEHDGEENRQYFGGLPYKPADLYGLYLPRILSLERIGFRAEVASTYYDVQPDVWYTHGVYTGGYTYHGMIMGHHMGTDSKDLFIELSCRLPENNAHVSLSYDREKHNLGAQVKEVSEEYLLTAHAIVSAHLNLKASCGYGRVQNAGNREGPARTVGTCLSEVRYRF